MADVTERAPATTTTNFISTTTKIRDKLLTTKPQTLRQILHSTKPPFSVKLVRGELEKYLPLRPSDQAVIFKVSEIRRKKNVLTRKMQWDRQSEDYVPTGSQLDIPSTYKGWFEVLPEDGRPVEYFDTIYGITSIKPRRFLVRTSTVGYQLTVDESGSSWTPFEVRPGEVLTTGIVYNDHKKQKATTNMKNLFKKILRPGRFGKKDNDLRYLQCFDSTGKEIMIPLIMSGVFSPIGDITETNYDAVYDLQDMLLAFTLPIKVQLVHGNSNQKQVVPNGVLRIEGAKDQEYAMVKLGYPKYASDEVFELPVDCDLLFYREEHNKPKKIGTPDSKSVNSIKTPKTEESPVNKEVTLPIRVPTKDNRKLKGSILLEKLSARRSKKERACLKALQEEGVFSSRLNKPPETVYDDFLYKSEDTEEEAEKNELEQTVVTENTTREEETVEKRETKKPDSDVNHGGYAVVRKRPKTGERLERPRSIQERTLPPIPVEDKHSDNKIDETPPLPKTDPPSRNHISQATHVHSDLDDSSETLYEKLPPAPKPPPSATKTTSGVLRGLSNNQNSPSQEEDGYLVPRDARNQYSQSPSVSHSQEECYVPRRLPRGLSREDRRHLRTQRSRSEYGLLDGKSPYPNNADCPIDIDDLFDLSGMDRGGIYGYYSGTPDSRPMNRSYTPGMQRSVSRDFTPASNSDMNSARLKSVSQRNLNLESNATIRSHNVKKLRTALELFDFNDSLMDLRDERSQNGESVLTGVPLPRDQSRVAYGMRRDEDYPAHSNLGHRHYTGRDSGIGGITYAESEPGYRQYHRSYSVTGLSDTYVKNGDDSAISLCSRGDYGFNGESEYSYAEYRDPRDDGWVPPDDIHALTVLEVSKSLRYIGMKDRVVIRFAQEQIDGNMLCSLDHRLLQEGFPELNMLEIKKIIDFLNGWRPKK